MITITLTSKTSIDQFIDTVNKTGFYHLMHDDKVLFIQSENKDFFMSVELSDVEFFETDVIWEIKHKHYVLSLWKRVSSIHLTTFKNK